MVSSDKPEFKKYLHRTVNVYTVECRCCFSVIKKEYLWFLYKAESICDTKTLAETWFNLKSSSDGFNKFIFHRQRVEPLQDEILSLLFPFPARKRRSLDQFTLELCKNVHWHSKTISSMGRSKSIQFLYSI